MKHWYWVHLSGVLRVLGRGHILQFFALQSVELLYDSFPRDPGENLSVLDTEEDL